MLARLKSIYTALKMRAPCRVVCCWMGPAWMACRCRMFWVPVFANGSDARSLAMKITIRGGGLFHVEHSNGEYAQADRAFTSGWSLLRCSTWNIGSMPCAV